MGGAGTLTLLLALTSSQRHKDLGADYAQFRQAYESYIDSWVAGDVPEIESFYSPKFVYMRLDDIIGRADYLERVRNGLATRHKMVSGEGTFKSVVPELNGYTVDVVRHLISAPIILDTGAARMHQVFESKEAWGFRNGRWLINTAKVISRKIYWQMGDGTIVDASPRRP